MQKWLKKWVVTGLLFGLGMSASLPVKAAKSSQTTQSNVGFSVAAKIPKNQINKKNSFFDLKMKKGQTETLQTVIYNSSNKDIKVQTRINTAYTNTNGTIEYVSPTTNYDPSLKYKISDITKLTGAKTVTVPANGSKTISAKISMPSEQVNGVILGGWYFKRVDDKVTGSVKGAMNMKSQYSYVIGLKYTSGKIPQPNMKLGSVKAGMSNYHRGIIAELRNPTAVMIPNLTTKSTITSKDSDKVVKKATRKGIQMAPNTSYNYPMLLGDTKLQAGKYHLHMVVKNTEHQWTFDKDFTITATSAQKYNKESVDNNGISIWWLIGLGALGMLVIVLLILWLIFFIKKRRQRKD
ncbi:DUF916 and DUF3324 domain-containing protein [Lactiplantibacillus garii]|uniref:DUF916 and DUF3324 domain-containing protein n=1 Tax=Lactiplantibacillus garii TaxID=2306423 RepID=A0A3R8KLM3_9LACO|nr:DUF916 and DUF3324 domain-containing protein [Lactiplantibacillus garii]RRK10581.1 DUF916 and DUF3324 domain-containing protein [Lactiplantibacillus garii]